MFARSLVYMVKNNGLRVLGKFKNDNLWPNLNLETLTTFFICLGSPFSAGLTAPNLNLETLTTAQLQQMEGQERENVQARV